MVRIIRYSGGPLRSCRACHHWFPDRGEKVEVDGIAYSVNLCLDCEPDAVKAVQRQIEAKLWDMCGGETPHNW